MQGQQNHYRFQNEVPLNDSQQAVLGQTVQNPYNFYNPQIAQPNIQQGIQLPTQPQQNQFSQPQYVFIPQGPLKQEQQLTPPQMIQMPQQTIFPTSRYSQTLLCKNCRRPIESMIHYEVGNGAYVIGGLIAAVGLWLGFIIKFFLKKKRCCLIPCMMEDCKDAVHYCPNCGSQIGKKKFLFE